jgi:hypothetical protein
MSAASNRQRILDALRRSGQPLDDDRLSVAAGVHPRQQVNQICRVMEQEGVVRRYLGPGEKLVNELIGVDVAFVPAKKDQPIDLGSAEASDPIVVTRDAVIDSPPGHSREQRDAERVMLDLLSVQLGVTLEPTRIVVADGTRVEIDGADAGRTVLVECWAHQGPPKVAQKHKVLADTLKLTWIATKIEPRPRLFLCLGDPLAARPFLPTSKSWAAHALRDLGVTLAVVDLPLEVQEKVRRAQQRQYR